MNWLDKLLPPKVKTEDATEKKGNIPEGLWVQCPSCHATLYSTDLTDNRKVCPKCGFHMPISASQRIDLLLDEDDSRVFIGQDVAPVDVLKFKDSKKYPDRLSAARAKTNENEALLVCRGKINGFAAVVAAFEFEFIGGSMGSVVGERFLRGVNEALAYGCPFICVAASGGARMQEGLNSLMQMAKTAAALHKLSEARLPFFSILTDPTMGGVSASFAFLGDVVIAEPGALIGFAGPRVIEQTVREKLPEGFQRAEFLLEKGAIDLIVPRKELKERLTRLIDLFTQPEKSKIKIVNREPVFDAAAVLGGSNAPRESDVGGGANRRNAAAQAAGAKSAKSRSNAASAKTTARGAKTAQGVAESGKAARGKKAD